MQIVLLGTGYPVPDDPQRAGPATLVRAGGMDLLFDAGRGLLMRLRGADSGPLRVHSVFLTHLHSDHMTDFNDLVTMSWAMSRTKSTLRVYGPPGTKDMCSDTLHLLRHDIAWRIVHHEDLTWEPDLEVTEAVGGVVFDEGGVRVLVHRTKHPPVEPTIGFRVEHEGRSVVIGGDGIPCEGLDRLCTGVDAYVQTVLRRPLIEALPSARLQEILTYHSSTEDAAKTAARAGVKTLVYTHMMPTPEPGTEQDWINDAKPHFDGEVVLGNDLKVIAI
jgi:ribonuclease Z